jgi:Tfp pilus assembly protein PilW
MTLVELMVAIGLGSLVVTTVVLLYIFGLRSFTAIGNYTEMDGQSRMAMDTMLREMRQASGVVDFSTNLPTPFLLLTNDLQAKKITYNWDSSSGVFYYTVVSNSIVTTGTNLTGCDNWAFTLFQRTPDINGNFFAITNGNQAICKLISMSWTCSRTNLFRKFNTESTVTAQVVLRNKP